MTQRDGNVLVHGPGTIEDTAVGLWRQRLGSPPSDAAVGRLGRELASRRGELEVQVEERLLRSQLLLETGHPERALRVIDEQRRLLERYQRDVGAAVAGAAAELEAERVLDELPDTQAQVPVSRERPGPRVPGRLAGVLSAVAALAFVAMLATPPEPDALDAAAQGALGAPGDGAAPGATAARDAAPGSDAASTGSGGARDGSSADAATEGASVGGWLAQQRGLLQRLGEVPTPRDSSGVERLVARLLPARALADELLDGLVGVPEVLAPSVSALEDALPLAGGSTDDARDRDDDVVRDEVADTEGADDPTAARAADEEGSADPGTDAGDPTEPEEAHPPAPDDPDAPDDGDPGTEGTTSRWSSVEGTLGPG